MDFPDRRQGVNACGGIHRRIFWPILVSYRVCGLALLVLTSADSAQAQFTYVINNGAVIITGIMDVPRGTPLPPLDIPSTIGGLPVTSIADWAFWDIALTPPPYGNVLYLTSVTIPNSVTNIGNNAFYGSQYLTRVTLGNQVTSIGQEAFYGCGLLQQVIFLGNAPSAGGCAFCGDNLATVYYLPGSTGWGPTFAGLSTVLWTLEKQLSFTTNNGAITITGYFGPGGAVTLPDAIDGLPVTSISGFSSTAPLASVTIPNTVTNIGGWAFQGSEALTNLTLGNSVTSIGQYAFAYCTALTSVNFSTTLTSIGYAAFLGCARLASTILPDSLQNIPDSMFEFCAGLTSVAIGNNVTNVGVQAFYGCTSLTNVTLPNRVASLAAQAFYGCTALTNVTIGNGIAIVGTYSFFDCPALKALHFQGNAPSPGYQVFDVNSQITVYYLPGATGWGPRFGDVPTAPWVLPNPVILNTGPSFGFRTNQFGFVISWATNVPVVIEACSNLTHATWQPLQTNTLASGSSYFSDPYSTNYPSRFYRVRSH